MGIVALPHMLGIQLPPLTPLNAAVTALQLAGVVAMSTSRDQLPYSKFAGSAGDIGSRTGMAIIYVLGLVLSLGQLMVACREPVCPRLVLVGTMLTAHYLKRELEVLYVHKYSGKINLATSCMISVSYGLAAIGIMHYTERQLELGRAAICGAVVFGIGAVGNAWHHWLLSRLRAKGGGAYVVPQGGLFDLVTCPHYLMELVAWLGIAISSRSLFAFLNWVSMTGYLAGRARSTTEWYVAKFGDGYPAARRKHLVPFVY
jgi:hypothetical protein